MVLKQKPFVRYHETKVRDTFTISLNDEEREIFNKCKNILEQNKDSTALKSLAWIGANVIQDKNINYILGLLFKNKRNNKRIGIADFE